MVSTDESKPSYFVIKLPKVLDNLSAESMQASLQEISLSDGQVMVLDMTETEFISKRWYSAAYRDHREVPKKSGTSPTCGAVKKRSVHLENMWIIETFLSTRFCGVSHQIAGLVRYGTRVSSNTG